MAPYRLHPALEVNSSGQRRCARGDRCAEATVNTTGTHRTVEPALGYRTLCETDRDLTLRCLEQLPAYYRELGDRIGERGTSTGPKVSGSKNAAIPVNLTFDELRDDMVNVAASWTGRVYQVANLTGTVDTDRHLTAYTDGPFLAMCRTLAAHLDVLLALPAEPMNRVLTLTEAEDLPDGTPVHRNYWGGYAIAVLKLDGGNAALEVFRLNARCRWMLGYTGKDEKITGRCFSCDQLDVLVRPDSAAGLADHGECSACGARYFGVEYTNLLRAAYEVARERERQAS